jgi:hypothetical protein
MKTGDKKSGNRTNQKHPKWTKIRYPLNETTSDLQILTRKSQSHTMEGHTDYISIWRRSHQSRGLTNRVRKERHDKSMESSQGHYEISRELTKSRKRLSELPINHKQRGLICRITKNVEVNRIGRTGIKISCLNEDPRETMGNSKLHSGVNISTMHLLWWQTLTEPGVSTFSRKITTMNSHPRVPMVVSTLALQGNRLTSGSAYVFWCGMEIVIHCPCDLNICNFATVEPDQFDSLDFRVIPILGFLENLWYSCSNFLDLWWSWLHLIRRASFGPPVDLWSRPRTDYASGTWVCSRCPPYWSQRLSKRLRRHIK